MYKKYQVTLWTDEIVYARSAIMSQFTRYSEQWRKAFIEHGAGIASVYLPAIRSLREAARELDRVLPNDV